MLLCGEDLRKMVFIPLCSLFIYFLTYLDLSEYLTNDETLLKSIQGAVLPHIESFLWGKNKITFEIDLNSLYWQWVDIFFRGGGGSIMSSW